MKLTHLPALVLVVTAVVSAGTLAEGASPVTRDITFFVLSDVHIGAENLKAQPPVTRQDTLVRAQANLAALRALVGRPYPDTAAFAPLRLGAVAVPRGLFILGDLTDGHKDPTQQEEQWRCFDTLYPAFGLEFSGQNVPVFAMAGNHDGDVAGPQRQGLVRRNRALESAGALAAISTNGVHVALNWEGVHLVCLNLCPADRTDGETPFKYGRPGPGSWNDPQGAYTFLRDYLVRNVGSSQAPVFILQHYGFDGFSLNDWNWWTPRQRRALYQLLEDYNIAAFFHGHNHHAEHYRWPDPKRHAADLESLFEGQPPPHHRQYDVLSWGGLAWVIRIRGDTLIAAHLGGPDWTGDPARLWVKSLKR